MSDMVMDRAARTGCKPLEVFLVVVAFLVNFFAGVVVLAWRLWRHYGTQNPGDVMTTLRDKVGPLFETPASPNTNTAFEEYKRETLERLEKERRELSAREREFEEFLRDLRRAKDKEEFDKFMASRA